MRMPSLRRLGIEELITDHLETWVELDQDRQRKRNASDYLVFIGIPVLVAAVVGVAEARMWTVDALLAGASILTGLLFGLLIHVLSLGLHLAADTNVRAGSQIAVLTDELRANVAWACAIGLLLTGVLASIGTFVKDLDAHGVHPVLTAVVCGLAVHLALTLLMILKRVRSTYKMLGK